MISAQPLSKAASKYFSKLLHKKHRHREEKFLVEGVRLCRELLHSPLSIETIVFSDRILGHADGRDVLELGKSRGIPVYRTDPDTLERLAETCRPQGIIACARMGDHRLHSEFFRGHRFLVLLDVSDPGNAGTLMRTAEAFAWRHVLCAGRSVDIYNPKVLRASMGAIFRLHLACVPCEEMLSYFEDMNVSYVVSAPGRGVIPPLDCVPEKLALILGNEAHGVPDFLLEKAHALVQIPTAAHVDSLNVSVAGAILLFLLQ